MINDDDDTKTPPETQTLKPGSIADKAKITIEDSDTAINALESASDLLSEAGTLLGDDDLGGAAETINEVITAIGQVLDYIEEQTHNSDDDDIE
jgi:hypothetical protein